MPEARICSKCGAPLSADGFCPKCLMQFGLDLPDTAASRHATPVVEKPGDRIGHYKLLQQIGEGGCGVVYMAEQEEPVRRRVALKIIKLGMDTRNVIARFEAERQALAMMDHPNIAKVLDAGATQTGRPYFVMELVRGVKITSYCDQQKLSTRQRLDLFVQVCQAVQHAHQKGIIHRDLKPSNILVTERDGAPVPKIIDFGIAKATTDQRLTDKTLFTAFEQFLGTPAYMSPEQAGLGGLDVDTRSDIYSLGVLLYEMLTGQPPFDPAELHRSALDEILRIIREKEPPTPSARLTTLTEHELTGVAQCRQTERAKLPSLVRGDLDWIVMKALEKDRARRYETANGLASDIQRHLNNEPIVARPPSNLYRFQKLVRRNKLAFAAAGAVAAALLLGLGMSTWEFLKERQARQRAVAAEQNQARLRQDAESARHQAEADKLKAQTEAAKSSQVAQFLEDMLKGVGPEVALGRDTTILREILDKTAERVGKDLTNQPEVQAFLRNDIGAVYFQLGLYEKAEAMHRRALATGQNLFGNDHRIIAHSLNGLALALEAQSKLEEAEAAVREGLAILKRLLGSEHAEVAGFLNDLAAVLERRGNLAEAETINRQALVMRRKLLGNENPEVAQSLSSLAVVIKEQGNLAEAETLQREALAMRKKLLDNEHPDVANSLNNLAVVLLMRGKLAEAEALQREALTIMRKLLGSDHPDVATALGNLAAVLDDQGKLAEGETMHREALGILRKVLGNEHQSVAVVLQNLAVVVENQGKLTEAEALYREALAVQKKLLGNEHPTIGIVLANLGRVLGDEGKLLEAEAAHREALAMLRKLLGAEHPNLATVAHNFARVLKKQGKLAEAEALFREALTMQNKLLGNEHPGVATMLNSLALVLESQAKLAEAESMFRESLALNRKLHGDGDSAVATSRANLARVLLREGKYVEADQLSNDTLAPAAETQPQSAALLAERGRFRARRGRFSDAAADFSRVVEFTPDDHVTRLALASLFVQAGQLDAYRENCRKSLERFGKTTEPTTAEAIAKACLILPASGGDLETAANLADIAVSAIPNHPEWTNYQVWVQFAKGLAEYRQGRFASAVEWMQKVLLGVGEIAPRDVGAYTTLAMARYELNQIDEARNALAKGIEIKQTKLPKLDSGDIGAGFWDWIIAHALMREAKALIEGQPAAL